MTTYPTVFSSIPLGSATAKNRLVMAAMGRNYAEDDGLITPRYHAHMERIAAGGVGTMILDATYVRTDGRMQPELIGLHDDATIAPMARMVEAVHRHGALIGPQLVHGGRQTPSAASGSQPVAPSPIPDPLVGEVPHELTIGEIGELVIAHADAARRAFEAGCDFVELHGAHGYLICQFLSPYSNKRDDAYGGDFDRRLRFLLEIIAAIQEATRKDFPILVRLSADELVPGGLEVPDTARIAQALERTGIAAVDISTSNYTSFDQGYLIPPMAQPDGVVLPYAEAIKAETSLPVIGVGKIRTPELAERALADGRVDFVALGRSLLADPDWPRKAESGEADRINHCIACNQGCVGRVFIGQDVWCTVNPACGFEAEFAAPPPSRPSRVLVAGGGPAGMQAALTAAQRGHRVVLCERDGHLGGQLLAAALTPYRPGWEELRRHLVRELAHHQVEVRLHTEVTPEIVDEIDPDTVVVATGSQQVRPSLPGVEDDRVITSRELLEGRAAAISPVLVAGGGCSGAQTAEQLARQGHDVTLVEQLAGIATDAFMDDRSLLLHRLRSLDVEMLTETTLMEIRPGEVTLHDVDGLHERAAETIVLCLGAKPIQDLADALSDSGRRVVVVGDAEEPRKVTEAIHEGGHAALAL